ncbi:aromatic acid exporter family protein [Cytobacillus sp. FJAT-54145]|uniref:Aromatic acid exporter family protein n=1 Tax=Cytobacillus spartinae TaxID=3299023 RepID=A0ABW6K5W8_9BACI
MTLGPRVFKTGLAVTMALYICYFFKLEPALFAGVAAIFAVQPSIYKSWRHIIDQIITNTIGALFALFTIYYIGNDPIIIGLVIIVVISISLKLKMENTISLTVVTVLAIMSAPGEGDVLFAANRFGIILIGIASAFLINILVLPPKYKKNYIEQSKSVFQNMSLLIRTAISNEMTEKSFQQHSKKLESDIKKLEDLFKVFDEERAKMSKLNPLDAREIVVFKQMLKSLQQGEELLQVIDEHYFQSHTSEEENLLFDQQLEQLIKCHEYFLLKYEGKVKLEEHRVEDEVLTESGEFLENIMDHYRNNPKEKLRLVVIGSAIFEYAFHLQRLNRLIEQYLKSTIKE